MDIKVKFRWAFNVSSMFQFLMRIFRTPWIGDIYITLNINLIINFRIAKMDRKMDLCRQEPIQFHYLFSNTKKFARMTWPIIALLH